ncbi:hypothetical protein HanPI659440_Chr06g0238161 [Helianthus annuus]|nr:hypothetical protein HanPI659440_Chr06g0238161 [Helianthus annuus]
MGINSWRFHPTFHISLQLLQDFKFQKSSFSQISFESSFIFLIFSENMSTGVKPTGTKNRKTKPKNPPSPNQAVINWREDELNNLIQNFGFSSDWGVQFPTANCTALDAPPGYITLYADFFQEGNFWLPMSKFIGEVLNGYGLHISRINALGLPRVTHFEFICRAQRIEPTFEKFNVLYYVTYIGGFLFFQLSHRWCVAM